MDFTIINYHGKQIDKCGYCKGSECSAAHGMHAYNMSPQDYQDLIDRGWRRSGTYCYKPHNQSTCCPSYTIKCDAKEFQLSKSHKKVLKRMNRFLRYGKSNKTENNISSTASVNINDGGDDDGEGGGIRDELPQAPNVVLPSVDLEAVAAANPIRHAAAVKQNIDFDKGENEISTPKALLTNCSYVDTSTTLVSSVAEQNSTQHHCKKAKQLRLERRNAKLVAKGIDPTTVATTKSMTKSQEKTLGDYIAASEDPNNKHTLKLALVCSKPQAITEEAFNLYRKYQLIIHNDNPSRLTPEGLTRFCYKSPLRQLILSHVNGNQFRNTLSDSYELFQKYQTCIHNDPPEGLQEYIDFLKKSPLKYTKTHSGPETGYGSFHQQYWLDDKLIAVAVIDILPYCVSSVYFFYDPEYRFLSLGTYGSLRELNLVQELAAKVPALKYYYMGFYIHSCPKMRYKGKLQPSYLLCPETYTWHLLIDKMRDQLNEQKYQRLNPDPAAKDANEFVENHLDAVLLLMENNSCITYREYIQSFNIEPLDKMLDLLRSRIYKEITGDDDERDTILEYGRLVGKTCAHRMLYFKG